MKICLQPGHGTRKVEDHCIRLPWYTAKPREGANCATNFYNFIVRRVGVFPGG
jgi:hypothetical protein